MKGLILVAGLLTLPTLFSSDAYAQATDGSADLRAKELYDNGRLLYEEGRYEDAILAWEEAYRISNRHALLYNVANAQERIGHWREALDTLNRYRAFAGADEREALERRIVNLERRLQDEARSNPPVTSPPASDPPAVATTAPPPKAEPVPTPPREKKPVWAPVTLYSLGAVGLATGTVFALRAGSARDEAGTMCAAGGDLVFCPPEATEALEKDKISSLIADISFGVGGACVLGGTLAILLDTAPLLPGGLRIQPTLRGLGLQGAF